VRRMREQTEAHQTIGTMFNFSGVELFERVKPANLNWFEELLHYVQAVCHNSTHQLIGLLSFIALLSAEKCQYSTNESNLSAVLNSAP